MFQNSYEVKKVIVSGEVVGWTVWYSSFKSKVVTKVQVKYCCEMDSLFICFKTEMGTISLT